MNRAVLVGGNVAWMAIWAATCHYTAMPWITFFLIAPWCIHGILLALPPDEVIPPIEDWEYNPPEPINTTGFIAKRNLPWEDDLWDDE